MTGKLQSQWKEHPRTLNESARRFFEIQLPAACQHGCDLPSDIVVVFNITGPSGGSWVLEVAKRVRVRCGTHAWPDCRLEMPHQVLAAIVEGSLTGMDAYLAGLLVVQGDVGLGLLLEEAWTLEKNKK